MFVGMSTMQKVVGGIVALAAIAGWAAAFLAHKTSSDLQSRLIASEAKLSDIDQRLASAHEDLRPLPPGQTPLPVASKTTFPTES